MPRDFYADDQTHAGVLHLRCLAHEREPGVHALLLENLHRLHDFFLDQITVEHGAPVTCWGEVTSPLRSISAHKTAIDGIKLFVRKEMDDNLAAFAAAEQIDFGAQRAAQ